MGGERALELPQREHHRCRPLDRLAIGARVNICRGLQAPPGCHYGRCIYSDQMLGHTHRPEKRTSGLPPETKGHATSNIATNTISLTGHHQKHDFIFSLSRLRWFWSFQVALKKIIYFSFLHEHDKKSPSLFNVFI